MFSFRLINLTITCNELLWSNSISFCFLFIQFFTREATQSESKYYFFFLIPYLTIFFLVSRDGCVFVCFYRRVPLCLFVLLSVVVVSKMYVLFMNIA